MFIPFRNIEKDEKLNFINVYCNNDLIMQEKVVLIYNSNFM
jgi:hypothetical protein